MKNFSIQVVIAVFCISASFSSFAQGDSPVQFGADLMSRYIWRGLDLGGESPSLQPALKFTWSSKDTNHTLSVGAWGAYNFNTVNQEADLFLSYSYKSLVTFTFNDYFFPGLFSSSSIRSQYFNYDKNSTCHIFEPTLAFNGTEGFPFTLLLAMNIFGADARHINDDGSAGDIFMSKYVEAGYLTKIRDVVLTAFAGAALDDPDENKGEYGFYGLNTEAGFINLGIKVSKKVRITELYSLPVQAQLIANPEAETFFIVFGISL